MTRFSLSLFACTLAFATLTLTGCKKDEAVPASQTGTVALEFEQTVSGTTAGAGHPDLLYACRRPVQGHTFRQYISNIVLHEIGRHQAT